MSKSDGTVKSTAGRASALARATVKVPPLESVAAMYEINQIEIPAAFMAIYCRHGTPFETRETIETRFEVCEALAQQVSGLCLDLQNKTGLPIEAVLQQCVSALMSPVEIVSPSEAPWLTGRLCELLQFGDPASVMLHNSI